MRDAAFAAGPYNSPYFKKQQYSWLQILTIEGLLNNTERVHYPLDDAPDVLDWLRFRFCYGLNMNALHIQNELVTQSV